MTNDELERLQHSLEGTCQTVQQALNSLDLDEDITEVEDRLLDPPHPVEECKGCGWWFEVGELVRENDEDCGFCDQCRPDEE